jgi:acetolactate synthase-1/2/3 large subunit
MKTTLEMKSTLLEVQRATWAEVCNNLKMQWQTELKSTETHFDLYEFIDKLSNNMNSDCVIITDAGSPSYALPQSLRAKHNQRFVFSSAQADMGFSVPGSIGVAMADPTKEVVVVTGDGSFMSNVQELAVIREHKLKIKIFVLNNNGYLSIRNTQNKFFDNNVYGVSPESGVWFPKFYYIATAFKLRYASLKPSEIVDINLKAIIGADEAMIIEVACLQNQEIIPTQAFKNGVQAPLDDMYPFIEIDEEERAKWESLLQ